MTPGRALLFFARAGPAEIIAGEKELFELGATAVDDYTLEVRLNVPVSYDYKTSGIRYEQGTYHLLEGSHYVKCTDEEFEAWK